MKYIILTEKGVKQALPLEVNPRFIDISSGKDKGKTWVLAPLEEIDFVADESFDEIMEMMAECEVEFLRGAND